MYNDTLNGVGGSEHAAKLGVLIAYEMCKEYGGEMYTLNPTNVDEYNDYARLTGIKGVYRNAQAHPLNQKAIAEKHAESMGKKYEDCNFVVAHIDGGITINAHDHGRMTDGNVGAGGDGAFTPTRIGSVPVLPPEKLPRSSPGVPAVPRRISPTVTPSVIPRVRGSS